MPELDAKPNHDNMCEDLLRILIHVAVGRQRLALERRDDHGEFPWLLQFRVLRIGLRLQPHLKHVDFCTTAREADLALAVAIFMKAPVSEVFRQFERIC